MRRAGIDDQIKAAIQDLVAPALHEIGGEVHAVRGDMQAMRAEFRGEMQAMRADIRRLDQKIDGVDRELRSAIDIRERLAALEVRRA